MPSSSQRRMPFVVSVVVLIASLACSLSTSTTPQPVSPTAAQPSAQTLPPVARVSPFAGKLPRRHAFTDRNTAQRHRAGRLCPQRRICGRCDHP